MSQALDDIEGVPVIVDDILAWGKTIEEPNTRLRKVLQSTRELNLNRETNELSYIG